MRHPRSAPVKRKASPQRSLRQLHPTTWPQTTRLPITLCHISDFCFHVWVLVEFLICALRRSVFFFFCTGCHRGSLRLNFPYSLPQFEQSHLGEAGCEQLSHTEHVLRSLAGGIPLTPNGSGVRAALTNNKLEQGEGKQQQYLPFSSPASTLSGQENRSGERRAIGGG